MTFTLKEVIVWTVIWGTFFTIAYVSDRLYAHKTGYKQGYQACKVHLDKGRQ